jgi:hypothetical protein
MTLSLGNNELFLSAANTLIHIYHAWDRTTKNEKKPAIVSMMNTEDICVAVFKGTSDDLYAIRDLLEERNK